MFGGSVLSCGSFGAMFLYRAFAVRNKLLNKRIVSLIRGLDTFVELFMR